MSKDKMIIGFGFFFLLAGILLGESLILIRFGPVLGGDSVVPEIVYVLSTFSLVDYLWLYLSLGLLFAGLLTLVTGIIIISIHNRQSKGKSTLVL
ncbi:MAG: hypothetical protein ACYS9C_06800 [Planctomycetota bacterium]|jgi:uncharacterized membrane protein YGL010W